MINRKSVVLVLTLAMIAGTAWAVVWVKAHMRLGKPGIKSTTNPQTVVVNMELPAQVLDFESTNLPPDDIVLNYLPKDTSYARRRYESPENYTIDCNIILMGLDRTSIHKADYCLSGGGWTTELKETPSIPIAGPRPYDLPVAKWTVSRIVTGSNGEKQKQCGVYVFWFVADGECTPDYRTYKLWLMWDLLRAGVLQRWAYVSYFASCEPGGEAAAFERVKKLVAASVPEFQVPPRSENATVARQ